MRRTHLTTSRAVCTFATSRVVCTSRVLCVQFLMLSGVPSSIAQTTGSGERRGSDGERQLRRVQSCSLRGRRTVKYRPTPGLGPRTVALSWLYGLGFIGGCEHEREKSQEVQGLSSLEGSEAHGVPRPNAAKCLVATHVGPGDSSLPTGINCKECARQAAVQEQETVASERQCERSGSAAK